MVKVFNLCSENKQEGEEENRHHILAECFSSLILLRYIQSSQASLCREGGVGRPCTLLEQMGKYAL